MALKIFKGTINGIEHTVQANSAEEAKRFVLDPKEVKESKAASAPENKSASAGDNK